MSEGRSVVVIGCGRSAIGSFMGALSEVKATKIAAEVVGGIVARDLKNKKDLIEAVVAGNVLGAGLGQAPAKQVAVFSGLRKEVDCVTVNKVCGSGLKAIALAADAIRLGHNNCVLAGGMENMSQVPYILPTARQGLRMNNATIVDAMVNDGLWDVYHNIHMGEAAEMCATKMEISRSVQDEYAVESYTRALRAQSDGTFAREIIPVRVPQRKGDPITVTEDEEPKKARLDKIPALKPAFKKDGTITAANASSINDGAAFLVLAEGRWAEKQGFRPLARLTGYAEAAHEPEWYTTAPITAIEKAAAQVGKKPSAFDLYEINEAFSIVPLAAIRKLDLSPAKVNMYGGAVALGHPIGCSGARIMVTLLNALQTTGGRTGLATLCIGGGEGNAMTVERI